MIRFKSIPGLLWTSALALGLSASAVLAHNHGNLHHASIEIQEWEVPYEGPRSRDPWVGGEDTIYFVGQRTHYVGRLTPSTGEFHKWDLEDGAGPHTVISDHRGAWYAGNRANHLGFLDVDSGNITKYYPPGDGPRDVHTMDWDSQGNIWFTEQGGNRIGFFNTETEEFTMYEVERPRSRPYGVVVHKDQPWVVMLGTNRIATVTDGQLVEIDLPREQTRSRRLAVSSEGHVWYADYADGYVGRYNPETEEIHEWRAPSAENSRPYAVAMDQNDVFWIVETGVQPNPFVGFDTRSERWTASFAVPSGAGTVRHMVYDADSHSIWFGTDVNTIGQARISE
ncbi:lyase [Aliidiomarina halalkaliphila]|uniref:Lyase n=1 Tax=Aliidiomarina halalkaliphila TaxID=2593535 RepID=A0A552X1P3_9GAMM|nr:SMP-30/gluconolactonase/LRE family protein [Aliidiomarina halalkaliphila]TRW48866.1 lyase [Aliidiomarina halalkaliphila]